MADGGLNSKAAPVGAGLGTMSMDDRAMAYRDMRNRGMSDQEIGIELRKYGMTPPVVAPEAPSEEESPLGTNIFGNLAYGLQKSVLQGTVEGVGHMLDDQLGIEGAGEFGEWAGSYVGPSEEQERYQQERQQARVDAVESGDMSEGGRFAGDAGDALVQSAPSMAPTIAGAWAGGAAGAAIGAGFFGVGAAPGALIGAAIGGAVASMPMLYEESRDSAIQNGADINDPDVQNRVAMATLGKSALETITPFKFVNRLKPGLAVDILKRTVLKHGAKAALGDAAVEGLTEVAQMTTDAVLLDPEIRAKMTKEDWNEFLPALTEKYGREGALSLVAGAGMGAGAGGISGTTEAIVENAKIKRDAEILGKVGSEAGVQSSELTAASKDKKRAADVVNAAAEVRQAEEVRANAQAAYDAADPDMRDEPGGIGEHLAAAHTKADEVRDKWLPKFGGKTTKEVAAENQQIEKDNHSAALKRAADHGIAPTNTGMAATDIDAVINPYAEARAEREAAEERLSQAFTPKQQKKQQDRVRKAREAEIETEVEARRVLEGTPAAETRQKLRYKHAVADQRSSMFTAEESDPQGTLDAANEVIDKREKATARAKNMAHIDKNIARMEAKRQSLTEPGEIANMNALIENERAKKASTDPALEAAYQAKQSALERLGMSPEEEAQLRADDAKAAAEAAETAKKEATAAAEAKKTEAKAAADAKRAEAKAAAYAKTPKGKAEAKAKAEAEAAAEAKVEPVEAEAAAEAETKPAGAETPTGDQSDTALAADTTEGEPGAEAEGGEVGEAAEAIAASPTAEVTASGLHLPDDPDQYFNTTHDTQMIPVSKLRPMKGKPATKRSAGNAMRRAYEGKGTKRGPLTARFERDGTFTVLEGNSTYANMAEAGWENAPVRVITDTQHQEEGAQRLRKKGLKATFSTSRDGISVIRVRGPAKDRAKVTAAAAKDGLRVTYTATDVAPTPTTAPAYAKDPRRRGFPLDGAPWVSKLDEVLADPSQAGVEKWLAENAGDVEHSAAFSPYGQLLGIGTNNDTNSVMMPEKAYEQYGGPDNGVIHLHTHPLDTPFSDGDVESLRFAKNAVASRVVLPDGRVMEMRPLPALHRMSEQQLKDHIAKILDVASDHVPLNIPKLSQWRIMQEAVLQALATEGLINYTIPIDNLTAEEKEAVNDILDRYEQAEAGGGTAAPAAGLRPDGRTEAAAAGQDGANGGGASGRAEEAAQAAPRGKPAPGITPAPEAANYLTGQPGSPSAVAGVAEEADRFKVPRKHRALISAIYTGILPAKKTGSNAKSAQWIEDQHRKSGLPQVTDFTEPLPAAYLEAIARVGATEVALALQKTGNAVDWYTGSMRRMYDVVKTRWPSLSDDAEAQRLGLGTASNARFVFTYIMSSTSQNLDVMANAKQTMLAFDDFIRAAEQGEYRIDPQFASGDKQEAMALNMLKFRDIMMASAGDDVAAKLTAMDATFREQATVAEWERDMEAANIPFSAPGQTLKDAVVYGSSTLGPKIGNGFWQNLNGNYMPVTIDLWMRRTWGRLTGKSIGNEEAFPDQLDRLRAATRRSFQQAGAADVLEQSRAELATLEERRATILASTTYPTKKARADAAAEVAREIAILEDIIPDIANMRVPEPWPDGLENNVTDVIAYSKRILSLWNKEYKRLQGVYATQGNGKVPGSLKPTWAKAASSIVSSQNTPIDQVANGTQRVQIERFVMRMRELLAAEGINVMPADLQAILWYPEKDLWNSLNRSLEVDSLGRSIVQISPLNESYDTAFEKLFAGEVTENAKQSTEGDQGGDNSGGSQPAIHDGFNPDTDTTEGLGEADGDSNGEESGEGGPTPSNAVSTDRTAADDVGGGGAVDQSGTGRSRDTGEDAGSRELVERSGRDEGGSWPVDHDEFDAAMTAAAEAVGPVAAQVSRVPADSTAQRYLLDDGHTGYALDGDNIIGVFSNSAAVPRGAAQRVLADAVAKGGRRLDGFNTFLPRIYAKGGFKAVARLPFNPDYAPSAADGALADWDAAGMEAEHPGWGAPDVVFMVYDPANASPETDNVVAEYDDGIAAQNAALTAAEAPQPGVPTPLYVNRPMTDTALMDWAKAAGLDGLVDDPHLTVTYSSTPVDVADAPAKATGRAVAVTGKPRLLGKALVQPLVKMGTQADHARYLAAGATHDFPQYIPHITLKTPATKADLALATAAPPFKGKVQLGPEVQAVLKTEDGVTPAAAPPAAQGVTDMFKSARNKAAAQVVIPNYLSIEVPKTGELLNKMRDHAAHPSKTLTTAAAKIEQQLFNRMSPIRRLEIKVRGKLGVGAESPFKAAEMAVSDSGRAETLMYYGAAMLGKHGEFRTKPGTVGLRTIFDYAVEGAPHKGQAITDWMAFMVARRAKDLRARGIPVPVTDAEINAALAKSSPAFIKAADAWRAHNEANIDFLVDTGRITKAQADGMKLEQHYVPFYRDETKHVDGTSPELNLAHFLSDAGGGKGGGHLLARDPGIKKMIGGEKQAIDNLMHTMVKNSQAMVAAGMRNHAANLTFDLLVEAGDARIVKKGKQQGGFSSKPKDAIVMWQDGKEKYVQVSEDAIPIAVAMAAMTPVQLTGVSKFAAQVASTFRQGVTISAVFIARNAIRGAVSTGLMTSGANLPLPGSVGFNTLTGFLDAMRKGDATRAFTGLSGMGDYRFGGTDTGAGKNDILIDYGLNETNPGYRIRQALNMFEKVGTATELADRIAAFETMKKNGIREDEAAYQALTVMNYSRHGANGVIRTMMPMMPFVNARLQGLSRITEGALGRDGAELSRGKAIVQLGINGIILTAVGAALWGWNNLFDEERREKYKAEPLYRRVNNHILYLGDKTLLIPKAFELGMVFNSIPEMMLDAAANDMGDEFKPGVMQVLLQTFGFNLIPAALTPYIEATANHSFFRNQPIEGPRAEKLLPRDRTEGASAASILVGQRLGVSDATGFSPTMLEHYAQGYGGVYYHMLSSVVGAVGSELGLTPPPVQGAFGTVPVISPAMTKAFSGMLKATPLETNKYLGAFYDDVDHITQIYTSAKAAATNGDVEYAKQLLAQVPGLPAARKIINKANYKMGQLNSAIRVTRADTRLSSSEKAKRLAPMIKARNELARQVTEVVDKIEDQQGQTFAKVG